MTMAAPAQCQPIAASPPTQPDSASKKPRKNPARRKAERAKSGLPLMNSASTGQNAAPKVPVRKFSAPSVLKTASPTTAVNNVSATHKTTSTPSPPNGTSILAASRAPTRTASTSMVKSIQPTRNDRGSLALVAPAIVTGGLIGCCAGAAILMAVSVWYDFGGAKAAITAARAARLCVDNLTEEIEASLTTGTYSTDEALDVLRRTTLAYASTVPGGSPMVERVFREVNTIRLSKGAEVDKILSAAYEELHVAGNKGVPVDEMRNIVVKHLTKLSRFANMAKQDVVLRNPGLKTGQRTAPPPKMPTTRVNLTIRHKSFNGQ